MISSMTGFGRSEVKENGATVSVEIRSLNHRFLDIDVRTPKDLGIHEQEIKELVGSQLRRGRVSVAITVKGNELSGATPILDKVRVENYVAMLRELQQELQLEGTVRLEQILSLPDVIAYDADTEVDENIWEKVNEGIQLALQDLKKMRLREGEEIKRDLVNRIQAIDEVVGKVEQYASTRAGGLMEKMRTRIEEMIQKQDVEEGRLEMEVAILAEKMDVTEECTRFKSHNTLFLELLENGTSEGRKLNFLLQEMHREANTIGAKANDAQISHWVVDFKDEIEKLREQVQNIE